MKERFFLDTNVLIYADDLDSGDKCHAARAILRDAIITRKGVLSTQVLQEFFVVATQKLGVQAEIARRKIELLATMDVVGIELQHILHAIDLHRLHAFSFWDALIIGCASSAGCVRVLTEDMQHGQVVAGVRIENPFRHL